MRQLAFVLAALTLAGCGVSRPLMVNVKASSHAAVRSVPGGALESVNGLKTAAQRVADAFMAADDKDNDGRLSPHEFGGYTLPDVQISMNFAACDANHDGFVSAAELSATFQGANLVAGYEKIYYKEFQSFDADKDEQLSRAEFDGVLKKSGIGKFLSPTSFYDADANGDSRLNPSEYEDMAFATYVDFVLVPFIKGTNTLQVTPDFAAPAPLMLPPAPFAAGLLL